MRRNAIDGNICLRAYTELWQSDGKCELRNTRLRSGESTKPPISSSSKPHSKTKKPSPLMGSKTERGLSCPPSCTPSCPPKQSIGGSLGIGGSPLQSHPSFPTKTTSPVATRRLNPKPTISIVGHVPTQTTSPVAARRLNPEPTISIVGRSPQKPPPPSQRDASTLSPRFQSWDTSPPNHLPRRNATLQP
jgi:hypothetical protein